QGRQLFDECGSRVLIPPVPVGLVEGIGVVVAALGPPQLVASQEHRHSLRQQQGGGQGVGAAPADLGDRRIVGRPLRAGVPGAVVVVAVAVALSVGFVVLVVVGDQVLHGEAVVGGDEVH